MPTVQHNQGYVAMVIFKLVIGILFLISSEYKFKCRLSIIKLLNDLQKNDM